MPQKIQKNTQHKLLRIYNGKRPLTDLETLRLIHSITDDAIAILSIDRPEWIRGRCLNPAHSSYTHYVGQGTCLASKYGKYGIPKRSPCVECKSQEIVDQLNYIFDQCYDGKYFAEWVSSKFVTHKKTA